MTAPVDPGDHNPYLRIWREQPWRIASHATDKGTIEHPDRIPNIEWQTRAAAPSDYENGLGTALEAVFAAGALSLPDVVRALNEHGSRTSDGQLWEAVRFEAEMRRLGGRT